MSVDSFRWLPWSLVDYIKSQPFPEEGPIPWMPLGRSLRKSKFALLTTGGLYVRGQLPFDLEREKQNPRWGDPSFRTIPRGVKRHDVAVAHWHYNPEDVEKDFNIQLPVQCFLELEVTGEIGSLASKHYSVMGYQELGLTEWRNVTVPQIAKRMKDEGVDCALLTPG
jgi:D-proline reductase (dithiol) PrdB